MEKSVVDLYEIEEGIAIIKMQDKENKNTFTNDLVLGLIKAFKEVKNNTNYKVVILTGYDNYFASGGTKQSLLDIYERKSSFTDGVEGFSDQVYSLALDCDIPVIAAMQGHGIGGGFVMGLFSDIVILSRESVYTTNFMKYGFTPGMGATYILPKKIGISLGEELLFSAANYRGAELEARGISFKVLQRKEVFEYALEKAREIAEKPRFSLITLKDHLVSDQRKELASVIKKELLMHDKTFHQEIVKDNINRLFGN